ncbi:MAG: hypothetical protein ABNH26_14460 [Celeribacter sp.]
MALATAPSATAADEFAFNPTIAAPFGAEDPLLAVTGPGPDTLIGGEMLMRVSAEAPESSKIRRPVRRPEPTAIDSTAILDTAQARNAIGAGHLSVEFVGVEVRSAEDDLLGHIEQVRPYENAQLALTVAPTAELGVDVATFTLAVPNDALTGGVLRTAITRETLVERLQQLSDD